jgi:acetolactate synthase I/III small subunit
MKSYRFKILIENKPAVLVRILSLIAARNYNINYLLNQKTKDPTISEVIIDIEGKKIILEQMRKQFSRIINVIKVHDIEEI